MLSNLNWQNTHFPQPGRHVSEEHFKMGLSCKINFTCIFCAWTDGAFDWLQDVTGFQSAFVLVKCSRSSPLSSGFRWEAATKSLQKHRQQFSQHFGNKSILMLE